jgi:hypothetical protein
MVFIWIIILGVPLILDSQINYVSPVSFAAKQQNPDMLPHTKHPN